MDKLKIKAEINKYIHIHIPIVPTVPRRKRKKLKSDTEPQEKSPLIVHQEDNPVPIISLIHNIDT